MRKKKDEPEIAPEVTDEVKAPEIALVKTLIVDVGFTDKYNGRIYDAGNEIEFNVERANELLADKRKLVHEK